MKNVLQCEMHEDISVGARRFEIELQSDLSSISHNLNAYV